MPEFLCVTADSGECSVCVFYLLTYFSGLIKFLMEVSVVFPVYFR